MPIRVVEDKLMGGHRVSGLDPKFSAYEKAIISGKIPCPFTVKFLDSSGQVVAEGPIPLTPNGKPKTKLYLEPPSDA